MDSRYASLPETEKDSDREQVERYLPIIERAIEGECPVTPPTNGAPAN
jgi:hypothetical protein